MARRRKVGARLFGEQPVDRLLLLDQDRDFTGWHRLADAGHTLHEEALAILKTEIEDERGDDQRR